MSSLFWSGNRLIQQFRGNQEELGCIRQEPNSNQWVLWIKDTSGNLTSTGSYFRANEYSSLDIAKIEALSAPVVFIWHSMWTQSLSKREEEKIIVQQREQLSADCIATRNQHFQDKLQSPAKRKIFTKIRIGFALFGVTALTLVSSLNNILEILLNSVDVVKLFMGW